MKAGDGGASDGTASRSSQTVSPYPILSIGQSKTSPPEQRRHHHTFLATIFNRSNSCKHGCGFSYLQLPTRPVSFGNYGKHPFDRGRNSDVEACVIKDEPVFGRPPPLRDKKFEQSDVAMEKKHNMFLKAVHAVLNLEDKVLWRVKY
ncbi:hypothetical protein Bca4012_074952 [Brassica carinata]